MWLIWIIQLSEWVNEVGRFANTDRQVASHPTTVLSFIPLVLRSRACFPIVTEPGNVCWKYHLESINITLVHRLFWGYHHPIACPPHKHIKAHTPSKHHRRYSTPMSQEETGGHLAPRIGTAPPFIMKPHPSNGRNEAYVHQQRSVLRTQVSISFASCQG